MDNCSEASAWEHLPEETIFLQLLFSFSLWFSSIYSTEPAGRDLEQSVCQSATSPHPVPDSWREAQRNSTWPLPLLHCSFKPTDPPGQNHEPAPFSTAGKELSMSSTCPCRQQLLGEQARNHSITTSLKSFYFSYSTLSRLFQNLVGTKVCVCNWLIKPPLSVLQNATITLLLQPSSPFNILLRSSCQSSLCQDLHFPS